MVESWLVLKLQSTKQCTGKNINYGALLPVVELTKSERQSLILMNFKIKNCRPIKIKKTLD